MITEVGLTGPTLLQQGVVCSKEEKKSEARRKKKKPTTRLGKCGVGRNQKWVWMRLTRDERGCKCKRIRNQKRTLYAWLELGEEGNMADNDGCMDGSMR